MEANDDFILKSSKEEPKTHTEDWPLLLKVIFNFTLA